MLVYHFVNAQYGLDDLKNRRLKVARLGELNDPFEFLGFDLSDTDFRWIVRKLKSELSWNKGILCFCKTWTNPVVWGHYADSHTGLCLGFEVPSSVLLKVKYVDSRLPRPHVRKLPLDSWGVGYHKLDETFMRKLLLTKSSHWQYEQEYRVFVELEDYINGVRRRWTCYSKFSDQLALKRVIVGDRSCISRAQVASALADLGTQVEVFKARTAFKSFKVVRNRDEAMWA